MPMSPKDWVAMSKHFEDLLTMLPADIPEVVYKDYKYAEYQIALEAICDWLDRNETPISQQIFMKLTEIVTKSDVEYKLLWEILARQVEEAFSNTIYPGDDQIITNPNLSITSELSQVFVGKHWKQIPLDLIAQERLSLPHFTPQGFCFYLPAFLRAALLYPDRVDILPDNIFYMLIPPDKASANWDNFSDRINGFTKQQLEVIKSFVQLYISIETSYPDPDREKTAQFWSQQ